MFFNSGARTGFHVAIYYPWLPKSFLKSLLKQIIIDTNGKRGNTVQSFKNMCAKNEKSTTGKHRPKQIDD